MKRQLLGIELHDTAIALLEEVERLHRKPIRVREEGSLPPDIKGFADTATDGIPTIVINRMTGCTEENIVHELFHLKMQAEGFPLFGFEFASTSARRNEEFLKAMRQRIYDPITHRIFFPEMRRMGLTPDGHIKAAYYENRNSNDEPSEDFLALYYFRITLEIDDAKLLSEMEQWYQEKLWNIALSKGKGLVGIVSELKPRSPNEMVVAFIQCANYLLKGEIEFEFQRMEERKYNVLTKNFAIIKVTDAK
jgi:hypothetical protein